MNCKRLTNPYTKSKKTAPIQSLRMGAVPVAVQDCSIGASGST